MPVPMRSSARLTYDDFLRFPDDGKRHELIDGEHYVTAAPNLRHQAILGRLYLAIGNHLAASPGLGQAFLSPADVVLSHWDVVEPDLLFVAADQEAILTPQNVQGPPALVVEISSPGTRRRDLHLKRTLFERAGVREYWIVDPDRNTVTVLRRTADGSLGDTRRLAASSNESLTTPLLPGLAIALPALFA